MKATCVSSWRRRLRLSACSLATVGMGLPAFAQGDNAATSASTGASTDRPTVAPAKPPSGAATAASSSAGSGEAVIVTGTRSLGRKARDSTSPINILTGATLRHSGQPNLADALTKTDPAINVKTEGSDTAALTANIVLRGLGPNDTLILVDGKRRHPTSNIAAESRALRRPTST